MADAIDTLREKVRYLDEQIAWAEQGLDQLLAQTRDARATLERLAGVREDHEALIAEVEQARVSRLHAQYVVREPVVIIPAAPPLDGMAA